MRKILSLLNCLQRNRIKEILVYLKLLPINYWLEFLDLVFFFKCKLGQLFIDLDDYFYYCNTRTRRAKTGVALNVQYCKTSVYRDSYFNRIVHLWNAIPSTIQTCTSILSFRKQLKAFYIERLNLIFDGDNIRTFKLVCPKCRRINTLSVCSC